MARTERVLALDIGASNIKAGEFEYPAGGGVVLTGFAIKEYGEELTEANRGTVVASLIREIIQEKGFSARKVLLSLSGQSAFIRFVKLPPVSDEEKRVRQIVEFEARQNVPFPIEQVIWDYQLIASPETDEMDVMFVVIKSDIVEQITRSVQAIGLNPVLVEIAPIACYNAARANHVGDDECAVILDIGARSCNLLFADRMRSFARTIPIAGHAITQQIAKEFNIGMAEAEELKRRHGFVALGGAYEAPESEVAATVSKIVRSVMTRLHGEINRSISVYRAQQKGNRPTKLYLCGGSSIMTYTDRFFRDTLDVEVAYLNPFQVISMHPAVDLPQLQEVAHLFSAVVGLGLRYRVQCPVEISLVPESIRRHQVFQQKKPYLAVAAAAVLGIVLLGLFGQKWKGQRYQDVHDQYAGRISKLEQTQQAIKRETAQTDEIQKRYDSIVEVLRQREWLPDVLNEFQKLKPRDVWIVKLMPIYEGAKGATGAALPAAPVGPGMPPPLGMTMFPTYMPGGALPAGAGESGKASAAESRKIIGFDIQGHSLLVESPRETGTGEAAAPAEAEPEAGAALPAAGTETAAGTAPATATLPAPVAETPPGKSAPAVPAVVAEKASPAAEKKRVSAEKGPAGANTAKVRRSSRAPELVFIERIRTSPFFDADPAKTLVQSYVPSESVRNLGTFTMRVILKKPIEFSH